MSESSPNEEEGVDQASSGLEEEGDAALRKPPSAGARLWDRVRSSLLRPKVKTWTASCGQNKDVKDVWEPAFKDKLVFAFSYIRLNVCGTYIYIDIYIVMYIY